MSRFDMNLSTLSRAGNLASAHAALGERAARWRPRLSASQGGVRHSEIFASSDEGGGAGVALALALDALRSEDRSATGADSHDPRAVLWVQDAASAKLCGRPYRPGLPHALRHRLIHVLAAKPEDALFALEEGVRCRDLACVIGELAGNPRALDFTASRRLSLAAERHGIPLFLVRLDARRDLSSARMRWEVRSAPSAAPPWNPAAPGTPRWHAELFRARAHAPGQWILQDERETLTAEPAHAVSEGEAPPPDHGGMAADAGDRTLATG